MRQECGLGWGRKTQLLMTIASQNYRAIGQCWRVLAEKSIGGASTIFEKYACRHLTLASTILREYFGVASGELLCNSRHQWITTRLIHLHLHVLKNLSVCLDLALPQCIPQELSGFPLLLILLFKHIFQQVSISLHQSLCILESMLQLFLPVSLNALE